MGTMVQDILTPNTEQTGEDSDGHEWYVIPCPSDIRLTSISKEKGTHGAVYVLWEVDCTSSLWVGQSIPALVRAINQKAVLAKEKRLHASSLYRCLRGESKKGVHKGWRVERHLRMDSLNLTQKIGKFPSVVFVSKDPLRWLIEEEASSSEAHSAAVPPTAALPAAGDDNPVELPGSDAAHDACPQEHVTNKVEDISNLQTPICHSAAFFHTP